MKVALGVVLGLSGAVAVQAGWEDCNKKAPRQATLDAGGARQVRVVARAGSLKIVGGEGFSVVVQGTACASSESRLEDVKLIAERRGDVVHVEADIPEHAWLGGAAALDLELAVPASIALDVDDGSGPVEVRNVAALSLEDGSGDVVVDDVRGAVRIDDGSGSLEISNVGGEVRLEDGSGEIVVQGAGSVVIDEDGSGNVHLTSIRGDVRIRDDGSGSISVRDVGGDFTVDDDGSGGIDHRDVRGRVRIPSDR